MSLLVGPFAKKLVAFMDATIIELEKPEDKSEPHLREDKMIARTLRVMSKIIKTVAEI